MKYALNGFFLTRYSGTGTEIFTTFAGNQAEIYSIGSVTSPLFFNTKVLLNLAVSQTSGTLLSDTNIVVTQGGVCDPLGYVFYTSANTIRVLSYAVST